MEHYFNYDLNDNYVLLKICRLNFFSIPLYIAMFCNIAVIFTN